MKTIFICLEGSSVLGAGGSLLKLFNNTVEMQKKSYHFYYRTLNGKDEVIVLVESRTLKIMRYGYAK